MSFRVDVRKGLTPEEINYVERYAESVDISDISGINMNGFLTVRHKLNWGETLCIRGDSIYDGRGFFAQPAFTVQYFKNGSCDNKELSWTNSVELNFESDENRENDTWTIPFLFISREKAHQLAFKFFIKYGNTQNGRFEEGENHDFKDFLFLRQKSVHVPLVKPNQYISPNLNKIQTENFTPFSVDPEKDLTTVQKIRAQWQGFLCSEGTVYTASGILTVRHQLEFGQSLYLRGNSEEDCHFRVLYQGKFVDLTWQNGIELKNEGPDKWTIPFRFDTMGKAHKVAFKFLINDIHWEGHCNINHGFCDLILMSSQSPKFVFNYSRSTKTTYETFYAESPFSAKVYTYDYDPTTSNYASSPQPNYAQSSSNYASSPQPSYAQSSSNYASSPQPSYAQSSSNYTYSSQPSYAQSSSNYTYSSQPSYAQSSSNYTYSSQPNYAQSSSSSDEDYTWSQFFSAFFGSNKTVLQSKKAELQSYIGNFEDTLESAGDKIGLNRAFGLWSMKNHPNKWVNTPQYKAQEELFKKVSVLRDEYKKLKGW